MHPVDWAGRVTKTNFALASYKKFQPGFPDGKRQKILEPVLVQNSRNKANFTKHKVITFVPIIALPTLISVSLQLNGMLLMWKIQQAMRDNAIQGNQN